MSTHFSSAESTISNTKPGGPATFPLFILLNVKSSTYYFHRKTKILADFQICISVPFQGYKMTDTDILKDSIQFAMLIKAKFTVDAFLNISK